MEFTAEIQSQDVEIHVEPSELNYQIEEAIHELLEDSDETRTLFKDAVKDAVINFIVKDDRFKPMLRGEVFGVLKHEDSLKRLVRDAVLEFLRADELERFRGTLIDGIREALEDDMRELLKKDNIDRMVFDILSSGSKPIETCLRAIVFSVINDDEPPFKPEGNGVEKVAGTIVYDEEIVNQMIAQARIDLNTLQRLIENYDYYIEFCDAIGVTAPVRGRVYPKFKEEAENLIAKVKESEGDYLLNHAKPVEVKTNA